MTPEHLANIRAQAREEARIEIKQRKLRAIIRAHKEFNNREFNNREINSKQR